MATIHPIRSAEPPAVLPPLPVDLASTLAGAPVGRGHKALLKLLREAVPVGEGFRFAFEERDMYGYRVGRIVDADLREVAPSARQWIKDRLSAAGEDWRRVETDLRALPYRQTVLVAFPVYFTARTGLAAAEFIQVRVNVIEEVAVDLVAHWVNRAEDLLEVPSYYPESGGPRVGALRYKLQDVFDIPQFIEREASLKRIEFYESLPRAANCSVTTMYMDTGEQVTTRAGDLPEFRRTPPPSRLQRLFHDWDSSSAGRAGQRYEDSWVLRLEHYIWRGREVCEAIPRWTTRKRLPMSRNSKFRNDASVVAWLERFDTRCGYDFAWFFFGVHGNLVSLDCIESAADAISKGLWRLPVHDAEIVQRWSKFSYSF